MRIHFLGVMVCVWLVALMGCSAPKSTIELGATVMVAPRAASFIRVDGRLDEAVWREAPAYALVRSRSDADSGQDVVEGGWIRLAWDDRYLFVAAHLTDTDLIAEGEADQMAHWQKGDVLELFLKPADRTWYWELYVTPHGRKTSYWFPGAGRLGVPSSLAYTCGLTVGAECDGTLNDWRDKDKGWTAEMAMPIKDLTARGETFEGKQAWRIFVGRYNYSRYLQNPELTMTPQVSRNNYHLLDEYAVLELAE